MFIFTIGLFLLSLFETTWLSYSVVVLALIIRSFIAPQKENYYLAFGFGILLSILLNQPIGILAILFLILVFIVQTIRLSQIASFWLFILPLSVCLLILFELAEQVFLGISLNFSNLIWQGIWVLPIYFLIRFWEERFVPQKDIRLKVKTW